MKLSCFLLGHKTVYYRQMRGTVEHCRRCGDPYAYTLVERLLWFQSCVVNRLRQVVSRDDNEIPF